ncbi:unnamed protein product [Hymenolepis diminuta]|uniref:Tetraspanin n=1 Tax=Hymenolepis diminuta TaxID=6216 RepID=A0A564Z8K8_HYMDI|nr:unnamed protein product [Hymenolepis diminuta]
MLYKPNPEINYDIKYSGLSVNRLQLALSIENFVLLWVPVYLHGSLEKLIRSYKTDSNTDDVKLLNFIQTKFNCCGALGVVDFIDFEVPSSCGSTNLEQSRRPGCQAKILQSAEENLGTMTGIGIGFGIIMICGMVFSLMLCCALREIN